MTDFKIKMAELAKKYHISHKRDIDWHNFVAEVEQLTRPELRESEDERIRKRIRLCLDECVHSDIIRDYERDEVLAYLEKQKEKPAEWSERDEKILASAMSHIADSQCFDHFHDISKDDIYAWLKSLRPQYHWKPSEEQMEALEYVIRDYREDGCNATANYLQEILDNLKNM